MIGADVDAPHCTLKGTLIWTVESLFRKSRTSLTCHQNPWASLSLSLLCTIWIYRRSTTAFGLLSGLHLLCQSMWLFETKVDQVVPEVLTEVALARRVIQCRTATDKIHIKINENSYRLYRYQHVEVNSSLFVSERVSGIRCRKLRHYSVITFLLSLSAYSEITD